MAYTLEIGPLSVALNRLARVVGVLVTKSVGGSLIGALCSTAVDLTGVQAVGLAVRSNGHQGPLCVSGEGAQQGEDSQVLLGVGPSHDAYSGGLLVEEPDLGSASSIRWPAFDQAMRLVGIRSVASFPLQFGAARFGSMTFYSGTTGQLDADRTSDGYVLAQVATYAVVGAQGPMAEDMLAKEIEGGFSRMAPVHQATGILMARLRVGASEAVVRLRALAFGSGRTLGDVAADIVAGRFEFDSEDGGAHLQ